MTIVGGTYNEINEFDQTRAVYGSGVRALETVIELGRLNNEVVHFYSCCNKLKRSVQVRYARYRDCIQWHFFDGIDVSFCYTHPFNLSCVSPRLDYFFSNQKQLIEVEDENVLLYGMVDADFKVKAQRVVYDPQSSVSPLLFSQTGSYTEELAYVLNIHEAKTLSNCDDVKEQARFFFEQEKCACVVIKCGARGAYVFDGSVDSQKNVLVYTTPKVHCVGSGDVYSSAFAHFWFAGKSAFEAAELASKVVACYADGGTLNHLYDRLEHFQYNPVQIRKKGTIYLAGPFFSFSQRWLVNQFYNALCQENIDVFSPLHNIGFGDEDTAIMDLRGLERSNVVLAIADGLDAGTMFEVGYAVKHGIPVVVFNTCEKDCDLQMLKGTNCEIVKDFATAVYKSIWYAIG